MQYHHLVKEKEIVMPLFRGEKIMNMAEDQLERRRVLLRDIKKNLIYPQGLSLSGATSLIKEDRAR